MVDPKADHYMDAIGLYCPEPVMMLHNKVRDVACGDVLEVVASDPSTQRDIPKFCTFLGHELISSREDADHFYYLIRIGEN